MAIRFAVGSCGDRALSGSHTSAQLACWSPEELVRIVGERSFSATQARFRRGRACGCAVRFVVSFTPLLLRPCASICRCVPVAVDAGKGSALCGSRGPRPLRVRCVCGQCAPPCESALRTPAAFLVVGSCAQPAAADARACPCASFRSSPQRSEWPFDGHLDTDRREMWEQDDEDAKRAPHSETARSHHSKLRQTRDSTHQPLTCEQTHTAHRTTQHESKQTRARRIQGESRNISQQRACATPQQRRGESADGRPHRIPRTTPERVPQAMASIAVPLVADSTPLRGRSQSTFGSSTARADSTRVA